MADDEPEEAPIAQRDARDAQDAQRPAQRSRDPDPGPWEARTGRIVAGTHRLDRLLCAGPAGSLYAATHLRLERSLTLLHLRAPPTHDASLVERAVREVRSLVRLEHPAVVDLHDVMLDHDGALYLVLGRLEGESLTAHLATRGRLDPEDAIALLGPVIDAMSLAHRRGLVHGALARESILVTPGGAPKLLDLGLAPLCVSLGGRAPSPIPLAPEQAIGAPGALGPWTDVWSLGAIAYACLAASTPYDDHADRAEIARGAIVPIESRRPGLPDAVVLALRRALARDPGHRFRDAGDLLRALRAGAPSAGESRASPGGIALSTPAKLAGASVALAAAIGGLSLAGSPTPPPAGAREPAAIATLAAPSRIHTRRSPRQAPDRELRSGCWPDDGDVD